MTMRKLLAGILLTTALPAVASITSELAAGESSVADVVNGAMAACGGGSSCTEAALAETVTAGVDITAVINIATASGVDAKVAIATTVEAGLNAGQSFDQVLASALAAEGVSTFDAIAGATQGAENSGLSAQEAQNAIAAAAAALGIDPQLIAAAVTNTPLESTAGGSESSSFFAPSNSGATPPPLTTIPVSPAN